MDFKYVTGVLRELSWTKIAQVAVFCLIIVAFTVLWASREGIYQSISVGSIPTNKMFETIYMSSRSIEETKQALNKLDHTGAIGIQIINVDFRKNIRTQAFFASNNDKFKKSVDDYLALMGGTGTSIFTNNEVNNKRIIDLLNGNFICTPYEDTLAPLIYQGTLAYVKYVCSVPIPPYYGKFTGYVNVYLTEKPTDTKIAAIRQSMSELSIIVYEEAVLITASKK